jgi:hypothetical protein
MIYALFSVAFGIVGRCNVEVERTMSRAVVRVELGGSRKSRDTASSDVIVQFPSS